MSANKLPPGSYQNHINKASFWLVLFRFLAGNLAETPLRVIPLVAEMTLGMGAGLNPKPAIRIGGRGGAAGFATRFDLENLIRRLLPGRGGRGDGQEDCCEEQAKWAVNRAFHGLGPRDQDDRYNRYRLKWGWEIPKTSAGIAQFP